MIPGLVSIIFPTRKRLDLFTKCTARLIETIQGRNVEIIFVVDDDEETFEYLQDADLAVDHTIVYQDKLRGHINAWNDGLTVSEGEYIVIAADDLYWGDGWLEISMEGFAEIPDGIGLVGFNDGHWDGNTLSTHYIIHRQFILD